MQYLLDTEALIWYLTDDRRLPAAIREDIECSYRKYSVSAISLVEIIQLQQINRIGFKAKPSEVMRVIEDSYIRVVEADEHILDYFYSLDFPIVNGRAHTDPFDRLIVSTAIVTHKTLISSDKKFPTYRDQYGLQLLEI
ncbi:MAG: type II toxin-antitoxin system VapC family toxin [Bacteroidales bacterium]|nr:type II toxin-antitoxin system VapC family toxin [Bacteroidales bacterium]